MKKGEQKKENVTVMTNLNNDKIRKIVLALQGMKDMTSHYIHFTNL